MKLKPTEARQVDSLGRIVLPKKMRTALGINENDYLLINLEKNSIVIRKEAQSCIFCSSASELTELDEKFVCKSCIEKLNQAK